LNNSAGIVRDDAPQSAYLLRKESEWKEEQNDAAELQFHISSSVTCLLIKYEPKPSRRYDRMLNDRSENLLKNNVKKQLSVFQPIFMGTR